MWKRITRCKKKKPEPKPRNKFSLTHEDTDSDDGDSFSGRNFPRHHPMDKPHKYTGTKCVLNLLGPEAGDAKEGDSGVVPNWFYIIESPIDQQYTLMNNYSRHVSMLTALHDDKDEDFEEEEEDDGHERDLDGEVQEKSEFIDSIQLMAKETDPKTSEDESSEFLLKEPIVVFTDDYNFIIRDPSNRNVEKSPNDSQPSTSNNNRNKPNENTEKADDTISSEDDGEDYQLPGMEDFDVSNTARKDGEVKGEKQKPQGGSQSDGMKKMPKSLKDFLLFRNLNLSPKSGDRKKEKSKMPISNSNIIEENKESIEMEPLGVESEV